MGYSKENLRRIFPPTIDIAPSTTSVTKVDLKLDAKKSSFQANELTQGPGFGDKRRQLDIGKNRTRRGNKKTVTGKRC